MAPKRKYTAPNKRRKGSALTKSHERPLRENDAYASDPEMEIMDSEYQNLLDHGTFLLESDLKNDRNKSRKRHRAREPVEEPEVLRNKFVGKPDAAEERKLTFLLPLKSDKGVQMRYQQMEQPAELSPAKEAEKKCSTKETFQTFVTDAKWKQRIASLAFDILENPEKNIHCIREMLFGLSEQNLPTAKSCAMMASLVEVFKDVLPDYRIHVATDIEKNQQMKKETLHLRHYEEALLSVYQKFLQQLERATSSLFAKKEVQPGELDKAAVAVKCMSELLLTHLMFNFRQNLISALVRISTCRNSALQELAIATIHRLFKQDRQGDATLEALNGISKMSKVKSHRLSPALLEAIVDVKISKDLIDESRKKEAKPDRELLSQKERKRKKEIAKVEKELQSSQIEDNKKLMGRLHSQILQAVFATYFRILRSDQDKTHKKLLPGVLRGVAKFVHLISVEFMDDIVKTLREIVQDPDCNAMESLLCIRTVFSVVSGEGAALNIDPHRFYEYLFAVMNSFTGREDRNLLGELLQCVQQGFIERKKLISLERASRCVKSLANLAMRVEEKECIALVLMVKNMLLAHPRLESLLDTEFIGNLLQLNRTDDVAQPGPLWELHQLRHHHHPVLRSLTEKIFGSTKTFSGNIATLWKLDPVEYLSLHSTDRSYV